MSDTNKSTIKYNPYQRLAIIYLKRLLKEKDFNKREDILREHERDHKKLAKQLG